MVISTRNPSSAPTAMPIESHGGGSSDSGLDAASISGIVIAVVAFALAVTFGVYRFIRAQGTKNHDMTSNYELNEFKASNPLNSGTDSVVVSQSHNVFAEVAAPVAAPKRATSV